MPQKWLSVQYVLSYDQIVYILTKPLPLDLFRIIKGKLSVTDVPLNLREGVEAISEVVLKNDDDEI